MKQNPYHDSLLKKSMDFLLSLVVVLLCAPLMVFILVLISLTADGPPIFYQERVGKRGKIFNIIKFSTMIPYAEKFKKRYYYLNESDGPVFKIRDDPRFTKFGKLLSRTGLDELPQFINVLRGEMSIVGPRPLPVAEASNLTKSQKLREIVKPGITSSWVIGGSHKLSFKKWMELDRGYVKNTSLKTDVLIILQTILIIIKSIIRLN